MARLGCSKLLNVVSFLNHLDAPRSLLRGKSGVGFDAFNSLLGAPRDVRIGSIRRLGVFRNGRLATRQKGAAQREHSHKKDGLDFHFRI